MKKTGLSYLMKIRSDKIVMSVADQHDQLTSILQDWAELIDEWVI